MPRKTWLLLGLIIVLASILRFYRISEVPYGLHMDEASIAYNAWSIAEWNRDENAEFLPLSFRSFGDYKPPLLIYLLGMVYKLVEFDVDYLRISSAVFGTLTVVVMYFIAQLLTHSNLKALLASFLLSISAWHITISRLGYEQNLAVLLMSAGVLFLLKGTKEHRWYLVASLSLGLSMHAFHTAKIFVPVLVIGILFAYRKQAWLQRKNLVFPLLLFVIINSVWVWDTLFGNGGARMETLIFFHDDWIRLFVQNVFNYLSLDFWILGKDAVSIRHVVPGYGALYVVEFGLLVVGLVFSKQTYVKYWLLAGLLPGILTYEGPHFLRTLQAVVPGLLLTTFGLFIIVEKMHDYQKLVIGIFMILLLGQFGMYLHTYYGAYAENSAPAFQYGYQQVLDTLEQYPSDKPIVFTDSYSQPYIFVLLYSQITPQEYQWGALNRYRFSSVNWNERQEQTLYVGTANEIPPDDPAVIQTIQNPHNQEVLLVVAET